MKRTGKIMPTKPPDELRERWKTMMREALREAVIRILDREGLQALTMDRVTQEAGIAKGTLYNYFQDKEDLIQHVVESTFDLLDLEIDRILSSDLPPDRKLEEYVKGILLYFDAHRESYRILLDPEMTKRRVNPQGKQRHLKMVNKVRAVFEEGIKQGFFRPLPTFQLASMFVMSCAAINVGRILMDDRSPIEEQAHTVIDVFFKGIDIGGKRK